MKKNTNKILRDNYELRDETSIRFIPVRIKPDFLDFVQENIIPLLHFKNYNLPKKYLITAQILANMLDASKMNKVLADSRNTGSKTSSSRVAIYKVLEKAGILKTCIGSEISGKDSRYDFTEFGKNLLSCFDVPDIVDFLFDTPITSNPTQYNSDSAPVILRSSTLDNKSIPFPKRLPPKTLSHIKWLETSIMAINANNSLGYNWTCLITTNTEIDLNPCVRAIFKDDFKHGGRLYSRGATGYQALTKKQRQTMKVDGESVIELDFSGSQIRMSYHIKEINPKGDSYMPEKILPELYTDASSEELKQVGRSFIKTATNIIINSNSHAQAVKAITKKYRDEKNEQLKQIIYKICKTSPGRIVNKIKQVHEPIKDYFFTGMGMQLQSMEAEIIIKVLNEFVAKNLPALSLHDAIICRAQDIKLGRRLMKRFYLEKFKFQPIIKT